MSCYDLARCLELSIGHGRRAQPDVSRACLFAGSAGLPPDSGSAERLEPGHYVGQRQEVGYIVVYVPSWTMQARPRTAISIAT
jgi:hypothetical protein